MMFCNYCAKNCHVGIDHATGSVSCSECGRVHYQDQFTDEPSFTKGAGGESRLAGNVVRSIQSQYSESYQRTLDKGHDEMHRQIGRLTEGAGDDALVRDASRFYKMAVERGFTRGRRTEHVAASCLYIACRMKDQPYLLIDFSKELAVNVYVLGAVFLQLCKLLSLAEHPIVQNLVDPTLFMHRFTQKLMDEDYSKDVCETAINIVASMKRDWMQTGRKPSGICGAALYISALSHGHQYSKKHILKIVHICEATLTKRLFEFEGTTSGSLTIEELNQKAEDYKKKGSNQLSRVEPKGKETTEIFCQHKGKEAWFAHGLCRDCYIEFLKISGGLDGEAEPPAFQRAEMYRLSNTSSCQDTGNIANANGVCDEASHKTNGNDEDIAAETPKMHYISSFEKPTDNPDFDEENLSDMDDDEASLYLHSEKERHFKEIIWEEMNKEFIEEQEAKQAAAALAAAASKSYGGNPDDLRGGQELAAAVAAAEAKTREKKRQKRALDAKNAVPPKNAYEAAKQTLVKKGLGAKVNLYELEKLFEENEDIPLVKEDTPNEKREKRKDRDDDIEQEADEEGITENYVGEEWGGGEEVMYGYDDYDPDNYDGEW